MFTRKFILGFICLGIFITGCSQKEESRLTFAVGGAPREVEFWQELVKQFQAQSGIRVILLRQPTDTDQRRQSLVIPLKSRKKDPDVFLMDVAWISQFAASDWLEPLDTYLKKYNLDPQIFFKSVVNLADKYQDKLIALPVYIDGGLLYYRKDLLKEYGYSKPPQTWSELLKYSLTIQNQERKNNPNFYGFLWQGAQYEGLICNFLEFSASGGGGIILNQKIAETPKENKIILDTPQNRKALKFMYDLIHKYKISPLNTFTEMKEEEVRTFFEEGGALFERNWPYAWKLHNQPSSLVKNKVGIAPLPHFPSGKSVSALGGWHIGLSKYSDKKEESFQFIKFILSFSTQKKLALKLGWNPARRDIYEDKQIIKELPHFIRLREVFKNAYPRPNLPYYTLISEVLQNYINSALSGRLRVEEALKKAQQEAQRVIEKYVHP